MERSNSHRRAVACVVTVGALGLFLSRPSRSIAQSAPGPIAAYSFNEGSGSVVGDLSGNNLTGNIVGATWTTSGKYGNALSFNGSTNYVDLGNPAALQLTGSMTVEAWVNAAANPADDGQIVSKSNGFGWQFKTSPDTGPHTFGFGVSPTSGSMTQRYSASTRSLNTWYHVAGVYNTVAGTLSVYVNGALNNGSLSGAIPVVQFNQNVNVNIGRRTGGFYFNGILDELRIYSRALSQAEIQTDMNTPLSGSPPPPDTTAPTISLSSPLDGATVTSTVTVAANAADNVGVAGVQFVLDGNNLGAEVTGSPFSLQWNTASAGVGAHTLSARARDFAGNTALAANISVMVSTPSPAQVGQWSAVSSWPIVSVHTILLPTGNVLAWTDYTTNQGAQIWRPATNTFVPKTYSPVSLFCSGHVYLADGRVLVVGGIQGLIDDLGPRDGTFFDPVTESWSGGPLMTYGRYYPTATTLPDGRVLALGGTTTCGTCYADIPEIFDAVTNAWSTLGPSAQMAFKYYPHPYVLPDGRILVAGQDDKAIATRVLDLSTQVWTTIDARIIDGHSSAMYLPGKIIKAGTATADNPGLPAAATAYTLDMTQPSPAWQATASMAFPRSYLNLTLLPDGQVLATGGGATTDLANFSAAVYEGEIWSPVTKTWTTMARMAAPRLYHSTALLLPDGRVLVSGGGRENGRSQPDPKDQPNAEIFSPPYLFKGARPVITSAPSLVQYASSWFVATPDAARIASVALIAPGAVTHAFNENQRFVPIAFTQASGGLNLQAPSDGNLAPPGPYMLFLVDTNGVPSVASWIRLPAPSEDSQPPTPPGGLTAASSGSLVSLSWNASTDNIAVTGYNIHRSDTSGFTPTGANKIGQMSTTAFTDSTFTVAGTYYYRVTAQDAKGNVSSPSSEAFATVTVDTVPPSVSLTAPAAGATVTGLTTITASATDDVGVVGVQFLLDGANLGAEVIGPGPLYNFTWASSATLNGTHTLSARARDGAGNTMLAANVDVTVSNAAPSGLVAAYSFSNGTGTTVTDLSGNNLTGNIVGATWTTSGKFGNALSFNGTSSYVDLGNPASLRLTASMTIEAWVKAAANPADDGQIVSKSNGVGWQFKTTPDTGPHTFGIAVSPAASSTTQRYSTTVRTLNTWYHVAGVYDAASASLSLYVNGVLDNGSLRGTIPATQFNQNLNVNIGRLTGGGYYFNGIIDEVRIYNRALLPAEIQSDMNTPLDGTTSPPDTTPPSVPANLTATAASSSQINLTWTASTDAVGVAGYNIFRNNTQIGSSAGPSYSDTGLAASTAYVYTVAAFDAAGNSSAQSNSASATTAAGAGGTAATPTFSVATGTYAAPQSVVLADASPGVTIYYTTNGSTPTTGSIPYVAPIPVSVTTTIKAIAAGTGWTNSAVATLTVVPGTPNFA
ncbi:MAG: LamG-like jellyroll fold domain-containing protein, partial [Bryobacteraceae bacterium]